MTLEKLDPCCNCVDHQRPYRNEDDWIITGLADNPDTWQAWTRNEWRRHCSRYAPAKADLEAEIVHRAEKEPIKDLAREYGLNPRTIYRYIEKAKAA